MITFSIGMENWNWALLNGALKQERTQYCPPFTFLDALQKKLWYTRSPLPQLSGRLGGGKLV